MSLFNRPLFKGPVYYHRLAPFAAVNGGAEEFVFLAPTTLPIVLFRGAARLAGQLLATERPMLSLHPTGAPQGLPQLTGSFYTQEAGQNNEIGVPG